MLKLNTPGLAAALAATLIGFSSCTTPAVESDPIAPVSTARALPDEVRAEIDANEKAAVADLERIAQEHSAEMARVKEEPAAPSVKAMGPWIAGDQIDSGRPGVKPIDILEVHANGSGDLCGSGKTATVRYVAMTSDGKVIDPGTRPFTFRVGAGGAIAGWDVVVAKMRVGDSFTLILPQELAYGPSKGDLKFDMELLSFK